MSVRFLLTLCIACALAAPAHAQSRVYVHPYAGVLDLDLEPSAVLGLDIDEGVLWGGALGYELHDRIAIEGHYATSRVAARADGFPTFHIRFHFLHAGVRAVALPTKHVDYAVSVLPGVIVATNELTDATTNLAVPLGIEALILKGRRIVARVGVRDMLHRCAPPEELDGFLCDDGEWLHHLVATAGIEIGL